MVTPAAVEVLQVDAGSAVVANVAAGVTADAEIVTDMACCPFSMAIRIAFNAASLTSFQSRNTRHFNTPEWRFGLSETARRSKARATFRERALWILLSISAHAMKRVSELGHAVVPRCHNGRGSKRYGGGGTWRKRVEEDEGCVTKTQSQRLAYECQ